MSQQTSLWHLSQSCGVSTRWARKQCLISQGLAHMRSLFCTAKISQCFPLPSPIAALLGFTEPCSLLGLADTRLTGATFNLTAPIGHSKLGSSMAGVGNLRPRPQMQAYKPLCLAFATLPQAPGPALCLYFENISVRVASKVAGVAAILFLMPRGPNILYLSCVECPCSYPPMFL